MIHIPGNSARAILPLLLAIFSIAGCARRQEPAHFWQARTPGHRWGRIASEDPTGKNFDFRQIQVGGTLSLPVIEGPGEITRVWFTFNQSPARDWKGIVLRITWDDAPGPSVLVPLGDFFGLGLGKSAVFENRFIHVAETESLNAFFPMPFRKSARFEIVNESATMVPLFYFNIEYRTFDDASALDGRPYFHARYNQAIPAPQEQHYNVLDVEGSGFFLGSNLSIALNGPDWWGEGDDVFTIDGERFWGTGTEDYYGGAWGWGNVTSKGTRFGVPVADKPTLRGGQWSVFRFHEEAPIPFRESFRFDLEHGAAGWDGRAVMGNNYATVAYYYLDAPQVQEPLPDAAARNLRTTPLPAHHIGEWFEAETAMAAGEIVAVLGGATSLRRYPPEARGKFSGDADAMVIGYSTGSRFVWAIQFEEAGDFAPALRYTAGPASYDFDLYLNGKLLREKLSGYASESVMREVELPRIRLDAGMNYLEVVTRAADPLSSDPPIIGALDAIRFAPVASGSGTLYAYREDMPGPESTLLHRLRMVPSADDPTTGVLRDVAEGAGPPIWDGAGTVPALVAGPHRGAPAFAMDGDGDRVFLDSGRIDALGSPFAISFWMKPAKSDRLMYLFHRNLVASCWYDKGKLVLALRDADFRYLYMETPASLIEPESWVHVRATLDDGRARIYLNGALVQQLEMPYFTGLNVYPGRTIVGSTDANIPPFAGALADFRIERQGTAGKGSEK